MGPLAEEMGNLLVLYFVISGNVERLLLCLRVSRWLDTARMRTENCALAVYASRRLSVRAAEAFVSRKRKEFNLGFEPVKQIGGHPVTLRPETLRRIVGSWTAVVVLHLL